MNCSVNLRKQDYQPITYTYHYVVNTIKCTYGGRILICWTHKQLTASHNAYELLITKPQISSICLEPCSMLFEKDSLIGIYRE